jgi:hypothetical protein
MVSAKDHMLCSDPHSSRVALVQHPDISDRQGRLLWSTFACNSAVHKMTPEQLKTMVFIEAYHLIVADGCDPAAVHRALWPLKEYRAGLSEDFPEPDKPLRGPTLQPERLTVTLRRPEIREATHGPA